MNCDANAKMGWGLFMILFMTAFINGRVLANNIAVNDVRLVNQDTNDQFVMVEFDLSWENSWRISHGPANWDAAWVFIKFRKTGGNWKHASLNHVNGMAGDDGHIEPAGVTIKTPTDGRGVFIYRSQNGSGNNDWADLLLRWNYGEDNVANGDEVDVDVFAIEMVYVPSGKFTLGGGGGVEVGKIRKSGLNESLGYLVTSEQQIPVAPLSGGIYYTSPAAHDAGDQGGPIPTQFPKGYQAFYCMKYEVSQRQWINFFNTLRPSQQVNNDITDLDHRGPNSIDRNTVDWDSGFGGAWTESPFVPLSFPLWGEILAYMDWSGLRPMTELEFVKACRGPLPPVAHGYAWGTNSVIETDFTYDLLDKNSANELLTNHRSGVGNANWIHSSIFEDGPYRCGIFAASAAVKRREDTGATYYGIMEMSGNLSEMAVTIGTPEGRAYQGTHGDGRLSISGEANQSDWPPATGEGGGLFGGSWFSQSECLWINDRRSATIGNVGYFNDVGFRCVRTAP